MWSVRSECYLPEPYLCTQFQPVTTVESKLAKKLHLLMVSGWAEEPPARGSRNTRELTFSLGACHHLFIRRRLSHLALTQGGYHCATKTLFSGFCSSHCESPSLKQVSAVSVAVRVLFSPCREAGLWPVTLCHRFVWTSSSTFVNPSSWNTSLFKSGKETLCRCHVLTAIGFTVCQNEMRRSQTLRPDLELAGLGSFVIHYL